jgi:hypothetical protein
MRQMLIVKTFLLILSVFLIGLFSNNAVFFNSNRKNTALAQNNFFLLSASNISSESITLNWTDNLIGETGFKIEKKFGDCANENSFGEIKILGSNSNSFVDNNISSDSIYCYRVRAYLGSLHSSYSNELSVSTYNFTSNSDFTDSNSILSFSANPSFINSGEQSKLTWSANGSIHCIASESWKGEKPISASQIVYPKKTSSYTLSCIWADKTVISKSIVIKVKGGEDKVFSQNYCYRNNFSTPLYQSSCPIEPDNSSNCHLDLPDNFSLNVVIPHKAIEKKANLQILIHNLDNFENLSNSTEGLRIVGDKIVQIVVKDENCKKVNLLKEISIGFSYPQFYANNFNENSFKIKKGDISDNSWDNILNKKDISSNIVVGIDKELGYFSLFGSKKYIVNQSYSQKNISSKPLVVDYNPKNIFALNSNSNPENINNSQSESFNPENSDSKDYESSEKKSFFKYLLASLANQTRHISWKIAISVSVIFSLILISWFIYKKRLSKTMYATRNLNIPILKNNKISNIKEKIRRKKEDAISVSSIYNTSRKKQIIEERNGDVLIVREV